MRRRTRQRSDMPLTVQDIRVRDETRFSRLGEVIDEKVVTFYIGAHGPFTERFAAAEFTDALFAARAQQLRAQLERMGAK